MSGDINNLLRELAQEQAADSSIGANVVPDEPGTASYEGLVAVPGSSGTTFAPIEESAACSWANSLSRLLMSSPDIILDSEEDPLGR